MKLGSMLAAAATAANLSAAAFGQEALVNHGYGPLDPLSGIPSDAFRFWTSWALQTRDELVTTNAMNEIVVFREGASHPPDVAAIEVHWSLDCTTEETKPISYVAYSAAGEIVAQAPSLPADLVSIASDETRMGYWRKTCHPPKRTGPTVLPAPPTPPLSGYDPLRQWVHDVPGALSQAKLWEKLIADVMTLPTQGKFIAVPQRYGGPLFVDLDQRKTVGDKVRITFIERWENGSYDRASYLFNCAKMTASMEYKATFENGAIVQLSGPGAEYRHEDIGVACNANPDNETHVYRSVAEVVSWPAPAAPSSIGRTPTTNRAKKASN